MSASAVAQGVDVNPAQFVFTSTTAASPFPQSPLVSASAGAVAERTEKVKIVKRIKTKVHPEDPSQQALRRRRQDTSPKRPCAECDSREYSFCFHPNMQWMGQRKC